MKKTCKKAFTLLELVLVITIIAILSAISIGVWRNAISTMRSKQAMASRKTLLNAISSYRGQHAGEYPPALQKYAEYGTGGKHWLGAEETKRVIDAVVSESEDGRTLQDISTLYVRVAGGETMQYSEAKMEELVPTAWGYMCGDGSFRQYYLGYNANTDALFFYYKRTSKSDNIDYEKEDSSMTILDTDGTELVYEDNEDD